MRRVKIDAWRGWKRGHCATRQTFVKRIRVFEGMRDSLFLAPIFSRSSASSFDYRKDSIAIGGAFVLWTVRKRGRRGGPLPGAFGVNSTRFKAFKIGILGRICISETWENRHYFSRLGRRTFRQTDFICGSCDRLWNRNLAHAPIPPISPFCPQSNQKSGIWKRATPNSSESCQKYCINGIFTRTDCYNLGILSQHVSQILPWFVHKINVSRRG